MKQEEDRKQKEPAWGTTRRLILRPWVESDAETLYSYAKDPKIGPISGWPPHRTVADSLEVIRTVFAQPETYAVVLRETGEPVGSVGILFPGQGSAPMEARQCEIGYWLGVPYWGQGLIPEAVEALLERCFETLDCEGVWCGYYDGNQKSKRVQEKCGFQAHHWEEKQSPMGDWRVEHFTFQTKEQWMQRKAMGSLGDEQ